MSKNQKILLAIVYIISLGLIFLAIFKYFDFTRISDYSYIKYKAETTLSFRNDHYIFFILLFVIFSIIWILLLGFASPLALVSGFIFGKYFGTLISVLSFTVGCTLLYILARLYFRDLVIKYLSKKIHKFKTLFNKNELLYFMLFRFAGGGGVPFAIQNLIPVIFDMKKKNYFYSTLYGLVPTVFILNSLGAGLEKIIRTSSKPSLFDVILDPNIYLPILGFLIVLIVSFFIKNKFFKNK